MTPRGVKTNIKPPEKVSGDHVRLAALGGLEEIGRNMSFIEYKNDIVAIDMGLQFPEETTPGVDFIIPNVSYLEERKEKVKAVIITHAHYDHIGAMPYLMGKLGNPPVYATRMSRAIIEKRQNEFTNAPRLRVQEVRYGDRFKISENIELEFFGVDHTIPETMGVIVKTPVGNIVHFADFRIEYNEKDEPQGLETFKRIGDMGVHTFMVDSTNAEEEGHSLSEKVIEKNIEMLIKQAKGRIILATFSSMITRIAEIIKIAEKLGKKVAVNGRSMRDNVLIAKNLGYVKTKNKDTLIAVEDIHKYKDNEVLILSTGAQGESSAGLMKIVTGIHKYIKLKVGDTVIFSSSVIPGNERGVQNLKDNLARQGAIVYTSSIIDIHVSGHAMKDDIDLAVRALRPKFVMPVHGYYFMRFANGQNAVRAGVRPENVRLMDNGQVARLTKEEFVITGETVPANYVLVDGLGVGDIGEVVLRDRLLLAEEGMFVVITTLDRKTGRVIKNPDIISRGFIYLRENQELLDEIRRKVRGIFGRIPRREEVDTDYLKALIRDQIGQFLYNKTKRRPMVLPVIIEI
ncbi:ribonuclease J [Patescibacteria group bacterium]|nr:ribonuclease J [Patescibacteria group bacterium]MCL5114316.1 ribonuclease J [Patescibacteria group bacterium]